MNFVIVIGAMKSGTTSLFNILGQHPEICSAKTKDADFFCNEPRDLSNNSYQSQYHWNPGVHKVALEASVAYTKAPYVKDIPKKIYSSGFGDFKFIYMLRHPLRRIESQIRHGIFAGWGKSLDEEFPQSAVEFSKYGLQLEKYLKYYGEEKVHLLTMEDFKSTPNLMLKNICQFLDINSEFKFSNPNEVYNSGAFFNGSKITAKITQSRFGQTIANKFLTPDMKNLIRNFLSIENPTSQEQDECKNRWRLNDSEEQRILDLLKADLNRLEIKYGVDVRSVWNLKI